MLGSLEQSLVALSVLLLVSVLVSKITDRFGIPSLLLFLGIGMLAGSEGIGGIYFDDPALAQVVGIISLALLLFAGGSSTSWRAVRPVLPHGLAMATIGVAITALMVGLFASLVFGLPPLMGLLVGSIVSSTDAAAVFTILRAKSISLKAPLRPLLELESGSNDPMAVFLTVAMLGLLGGTMGSWTGVAVMLLRQMAIGAAVGIVAGELLPRGINRLRLGYDGLYSVFTLACALLVYGLTAWLGGNGFLATYLTGLIMARHDFVHKRSLIRFHDGLGWLMQIALFLVLGLLVFPSRLVPEAGHAALVALWLMFVARPVAVFVTLLPTRSLDWRQKVFASWVGLRGAAPILLATFPYLAGTPQADLIFNVVFFVVLASVLLQGTLIPAVAKLLRVDEPMVPRPAYPIEYNGQASQSSVFCELEVVPDTMAAGRAIVSLRLPPELLVLLIARGAEFLIPAGGSILQAGDRLLVLSEGQALAQTIARTGLREVAEE
jgi:potassium/hydrogen antiporter